MSQSTSSRNEQNASTTQSVSSLDINEAGLEDVLSPTLLPSGRRISNRLVKVALYEHLADLFGGPPNDAHLCLYRRWAESNWGMIITGNVQVCDDHLSLGRDIVVPPILSQGTIRPFANLAAVIHRNHLDPSHTPLAVMQLSHSGRQSANIIGGRAPFYPPFAPSSVPLRLSPKGGIFGTLLHRFLFQTPREIGVQDIDGIVNGFLRGATLASLSGFDGVELHAGHGYLLSQFMNPKTNLRTDEYSVTENGLAFLKKILFTIRSSDDIPGDFVVGIKLNAGDYIDKDTKEIMTTEQTDLPFQHVKEIASWGTVDFIEISGGNYEHPDFMNNGPRRSSRQALFADFSRRVVTLLDTQRMDSKQQPPLVLLTGGLCSPELLTTALSKRHADLLGIGRLSVICPDLPARLAKHIQDPKSSGEDSIPENFRFSGLSQIERTLARILSLAWNLIPTFLRPQFPSLVGAGVEMARYNVAIRSLAYGKKEPETSEGILAVIRMWLYLSPGSNTTHTLERRLLWTSIAGAYVLSAVLLAWAVTILRQ